MEIYKASQTVKAELVPTLDLIAQRDIDCALPENASFNDYRMLYERQAAEIYRLLAASLPGGTLDQLLVKMLEAKASLFKVVSYPAQERPEGI